MARPIYYGIVPTGDGHYVFVSAVQQENGWRLGRPHTWNQGNTLRNALLGFKRIALGLPSWWQGADTTLTLPGSEKSRTDCTTLPYVHTVQKTLHEKNLSANLCAIFPEDSFLASLPLTLTENCPSSFFSLYSRHDTLVIGAVVNKKLVLSLPVPAGNPVNHLDRINSYLVRTGLCNEAIKTLFLFQDTALPSESHYTPVFLHKEYAGLPENEDALKAAGVACAQSSSATPDFTAATSRSRLAGVRTLLVSATIGLFLLVLLAGILLSGATGYAGHLIEQEKQAYEKTLLSNTDLANTLAANAKSAEQILGMGRRLTHPTGWTSLFSTLDSLRPSGLYFEKFGSAELVPDSNHVACALSGWAMNDTAVTEYMDRLQKCRMLGSLSLSSMEQNAENGHTLFTILCTANF